MKLKERHSFSGLGCGFPPVCRNTLLCWYCVREAPGGDTGPLPLTSSGVLGRLPCPPAAAVQETQGGCCRGCKLAVV